MTSRKERAASRRRRQQMNTILAVAAILMIVVVGLFLLSGTSSNSTQAVAPAEIGKTLADFSLNDLNGKSVRLSDYAGKTVLINAWATWCPPCKAEMPDLHSFYQAHHEDNFVILAINAGETSSQASAFAASSGLSFPILLDPDASFLTSLGVHSFPTSILVGPDGVVKTIRIGMYTPESLEADVIPHLVE